MNYAQARDAVRGTLRFGDDYQIRALHFLADVAEVQERIQAAEECEECNGYGVIGKYCDCGDDCRFVEWTRCAECRGTGYFFHAPDLIDLIEHKPEILTEAIEELYLRNYRAARAK